MQITRSIAIQKETKSLGRTFLLPVILVLMFILTNAFFATVAVGREPLPVKVGAYANPPKIFMNENGKVSGFWPDLIDHIAKTENWKIEYVWGTWSDGLDRLRNKEIDIMPDVGFTKKRSKLYVFSEAPVLSSWSRVYVNNENTEIQCIPDLKNKKIAALKGSVNLEGPGGIREIAQGFDLNCTFLELDSYTEVFKAIEENKADAGITNRNFGNKYARNFRVKMTPIIFQPINVKFAFPKDGKQTPFLVKKINDRMKKLKQDENSPYYQLLKKYFEAEIAEKKVQVLPGWLKTAMESTGFLLLLFILVIIISRIEVRRKTHEIEIKNEMLRKSEEKYRTLFEDLYDVYYSTDPNGLISIISPSVEKWFGYKPDEIIGRDMKSLYVNPQEREEFLRQINQHGSVNDFEAQFRRKDSSVIWASTNARILKDEKGNFLGVEGIARDVTERKRADQKIRHLNQVLRAVRNINQLITRENDRDRLLQAVCHVLIENRGVYNAWIAIFDESQVAEISVEAGLGDNFQPMAELLKQGKLPGCASDALEKSGVVVTEHPKSHCAGCPLAEDCSGRAAMTVRLEHSDKVYGVINASIPKFVASNQEESGLFAEMAGDIAFALYNLELEEERRQKEEALRTSKERYSVLVEESFDGIFIQKGPKIIFANRRLHDMLGYDHGELVGLDHWLVYHPEYHKLTRERALARMRGEETTTHYEVKMQRKDGSWFYAEIGARVMTIEGKPGIQVWIKDITERKQAEEILRKSETRLRNLFEASPLGIGVVQDRKMQWHNETMSRMLGYSAEELCRKNARMLYSSDEEFERVGEAINDLGPGKSTTEIETQWIRKDGSVFDCHVRYALQDPESEDSVVIAIVEDVTEKKKAEQEKKKLEAQLNQAQRMEAIGTLAGGVAHDFNNILTAIIGNAELALMDFGKNVPGYENIEEIRKAGQRAASLTRQLLAFSRKELIRPEILSLNHVTMNLEKMLRRLIGEDIELITAFEPDLWQVEVDPGQMEQVIMNLSVNARDAMPKGGELTIETANVELDEAYFREHGVENEAGPYVMLAVTDTGTGMDKETQDRIFEPFFTTKEMGRGTGLGLSTVYGIVKQNKGHLWVYSEEGKGTTFKVYLPRVDADIEGVEEDKSSGASLSGSETILMAEDDDMLRDMAKKILERYGYRAIAAENGKEAMKIAGSHDGPIHLLITDVVMPGMSGRDLAAQLKSRVPEIKILYMSGYTDNAIAHHGVLEKNVDFIQKPFTREGLARKVREVLDKRQD